MSPEPDVRTMDPHALETLHRTINREIERLSHERAALAAQMAEYQKLQARLRKEELRRKDLRRRANDSLRKS